VTGDATVEISKWSMELGITGIPVEVIDWIEPLVRSVAVRVCVPTVPRITWS
jgi:hypothetical protein